MDIKRYLPNKKVRRSDRLVLKEMHCQGKEKQSASNFSSTFPLGFFDTIPLELRFNIFQFLSIEDLSMLMITSKKMRNLAEAYRVTRFSGPHSIPFQKIHTVLAVEQQAKMLSLFHKLGRLVKRSTCLYATKDRLNILNEFLTRVACCNTTCKDQPHCVALLCYGKFLHTVIAGWDDSECQRVYDSVCQHLCLLKMVKTVVSSRPGQHSELESRVRLFFRRIFLDPCNTISDKAFWISRVLKPWPIVFQARVLYILYTGHFSGGVIKWHEMSETTPHDIDNSSAFYGGLSSVLQILHLHSREWSHDEIVCIIDELTSSPEDWLLENVAGLLLSCGESITTKMLSSKAINGRYGELAGIIAYLCLVCVKYQFDLSQVMVVLESVCSVIDSCKNKVTLLNRILDFFKELIMDTHEFTESDDGNDTEFFYHVTAMTEFTKHLLQL
ncbi:F-box only protein 47, partial [Elysia marginata]